MENTKKEIPVMTMQKALIAFLVPLAAVISLVLCGIDIMVAMLAAIVVVSAIAMIYGFKWSVIEDGIIDGGKGVLGAVLIMIMAGMLIGIWMESGSVPSMLYTTVPLFIICLVIYGVMGMRYGNSDMALGNVAALMDGLQAGFHISPLMLLPPVLIIVLSIKRVPSLAVFGIGIVFSVIWAIIFQETTLTQVLHSAINGFTSATGNAELDGLLSRGGANSMSHVIFTVMMAGMFSGLLRHLSILSVIMGRIMRHIHSARSLVLTTLGTCIALMLGGGRQYTTLTLPGAAFGEAYEDMDIHPAVLSRSMEDVGTMIDCLIPWTVSGIFYSGVFGVATLEYFPFAFLALLSPFMAAFNAIFGFGLYHKDDRMAYRPLWRRGKHSKD